MDKFKNIRTDATLKSMYNYFVDCVNKSNLNIFELKISEGVTSDGKKGLCFDFDTEMGLSNEEACETFQELINKHPECSLSYNLPCHDLFYELLLEKCDTVLVIEKQGISLTKL